MALTVKHLNSDSSFLLSFEPVIPESVAGSVIPRPFTILLDPWITGSSTIFHARISITSHKRPACISSLAELPQPPDLVIISQHKPDHCNEATLRQLPARGDTIIIAEPASARLIKSWKYFDKEKVRTVERWEDPRLTGKQSVVRIPVPPLQPNGQEGEVTVAYIPQKHDIAGLHSAIGITYKAPPTHGLKKLISQSKTLTPPSTPGSYVNAKQYVDAEGQVTVITPSGDTFLLPPTPPMSPVSPVSSKSLRSIRSVSTLIASPTHNLYSPSFRPATSRSEKALPPSPYSHSRPISLIFSPHGIQYSYIAHYATSHLVAEAALPLTALLHCMDSIDNPWWLGGNICAGVPYGAEIASKLGARLWISAHDGEKNVRGLATGLLKTRRWDDKEIRGYLENKVDGPEPGLGLSHSHARKSQVDLRQQQKKGGAQRQKNCTEVLRLDCGEEILVSGTGQLWRTTNDNDNTQSIAKQKPNLVKEEEIPPVPPLPPLPPLPLIPKSSVAKIRNQKKYSKSMETLVLPTVQDGMSPRKTGRYRTLRTLDLIKPSPRLIIEHEGHDTPNVRPPARPPRSPIESPLGNGTGMKTTKAPVEPVGADAPISPRSVRFAT
ncbi:hypothetical protein F4808DRAFT_223001 [Astrocystis sublimbata]|nr:hypothetical protein F4808DRAFT_223001 [Astrocystis sublimbata]